MSNKIACITGATSGIGAEFARRFAADGYDLILTGRRAEVISRLSSELAQKYNVQVETLLVELSDEKAIDDLAEKLKKKNIDVLINNAGFGINQLFFEGDIKNFEKMVTVHVNAPMKLTYAVLPGMLSHGSGIIINVCSEAVFVPFRRNAIYSATKAFLKTFSECLYMDLSNTGIRVQALCPGLTRTDFHEKLGMDKSRQLDHGMVHWMSPVEVVNGSMRDLEKGNLVSIPGFRTKALIFMLSLLPKRVYYNLLSKAMA
jgi:short-subunit dehydrogenase